MVELEVSSKLREERIEADQGTWGQNKIIRKSEVMARISKFQKKNKEPMFLSECVWVARLLNTEV